MLSATPERAEEARASAAAFLTGPPSARWISRTSATPTFLAGLARSRNGSRRCKALPRPDLSSPITRDDGTRTTARSAQLTWNTFRDHLILEYEIPKWDGDLGRPTVYMPVSEAVVERKVDLLHAPFPEPGTKHWFDRDTFRGLARLRGLESGSPTALPRPSTHRSSSSIWAVRTA